eukprot:4007284-Amphidinium_carterae.1
MEGCSSHACVTARRVKRHSPSTCKLFCNSCDGESSSVTAVVRPAVDRPYTHSNQASRIAGRFIGCACLIWNLTLLHRWNLKLSNGWCKYACTEQQQDIERSVVRPVARHGVPPNIPEVMQTPWIQEFGAPIGGWITVDLANVQRLRNAEQGNPPPPEIVRETVMTEPPARGCAPHGIQSDLASIFRNADEMVEAYQKGPKTFPETPIQGPPIAPTTVSITTPLS